jgi:hypothetical protein
MLASGLANRRGDCGDLVWGISTRPGDCGPMAQWRRKQPLRIPMPCVVNSYAVQYAPTGACFYRSGE